MSYFIIGGTGKKHRTSKPPSTRRVWGRAKGDATWPTISQNPFHWHPSWLSNGCATRKKPVSKPLAKDNTEINPITIKPNCEPHGRAVLLVSWPYCCLPGHPFPIKSLVLSARVSPQTIHFLVLGKSPLLGPRRGSPFLQRLLFITIHWNF